LLIQHAGEDIHQPANLVFGPLPVFGGESVYRQDFDAKLGARSDDPAQILRARPVTGNTWQVAPARPPAVAIHDDGDMLWHRQARQVQRLFGRGHQTSMISADFRAPISSICSI